MRAKLEFDLNESDDRAAHTRCVNADNYVSALHDISNVLRRWRKKWDTAEVALESISDITISIDHLLADL